MWLAETGVRCDPVGFLEQPLDQLDAVRHRLPRAAGLLDVEGVELRAGGQALLLEHAVDLVGLAAEADHHHRGEVGMARIAAEGAAQHLQRLAGAVGGAAGAVGQGDDAVDVREALERLRVGVAAEVVGDGAGHRRRAVHRGQDADVVAGGDAAVGADDAVEGRRRVDVGGGLGAARRRVVAGEARELEVVRVHVLARRDRDLGAADDLVVAAHRLAGRDRAGRDLVPRRDQADDGDPFALDPRAADELLAGDDDVVVRMDADDEAAVRGRRVQPVVHRSELHSSMSFGSQAWTFCFCSPRPAMPSFISSPALR